MIEARTAFLRLSKAYQHQIRYKASTALYNKMAEQEHIPPLMPAIHLPNDKPYSFTNPPSPQSLIYTTERPTPRPSPTQYLLKIQAAALTRSELSWPEVLDSSRTHPAIPAHDICGVVLSTPQQNTSQAVESKFKVGDEVFGLLSFARDGGAADCAVAEEEELAFKPRNVSAAEASAVPLSALTAWQALLEKAGLKDVAVLGNPEEEKKGGGERTIRVLITSISGGVGVQAAQLLRSSTLFGSQKFWICGTCSHRNAAFVTDELGADAVLDYTVEPDISKAFSSHGWEPVDVVFDCIGGDSLKQVHSPTVVRDGGKVISVAEPPKTEEWGENLGQVKDRGVKVEYFIVETNGAQMEKIGLLVEKGELRPFVDRVYDLVDAREAMERVESSRVRGKVVLRVNYYDA